MFRLMANLCFSQLIKNYTLELVSGKRKLVQQQERTAVISFYRADSLGDRIGTLTIFSKGELQ